MFCTSPPIFDDVTVTVSSAAPDDMGAVMAAREAEGTLSFASADLPPRTIVIALLPCRFIRKPVPARSRASASSADRSPFTPFEGMPLTASTGYSNETPDCLEYESNARPRSPPGMLNCVAEAAAQNATNAMPAKSAEIELLNFNMLPPGRFQNRFTLPSFSAKSQLHRRDLRRAGRMLHARRLQSLERRQCGTCRRY